MYFVDTGDGIEYYDTELEARKSAEAAIDSWRDLCDPEWPTEVEQVCWGKIIQHVREVLTEDDDTEYADYQLADVPETGSLHNEVE